MMEQSENDAPLRNDGWSVHHRSEFEKDLDAIAKKIAGLKEAIVLVTTDTDEPQEICGS